MTIELFREDGYLQSCEAIVTAVMPGAFTVDRTVFYAMGGGQPGDNGHALRENGEKIPVIDCRMNDQRQQIQHFIGENSPLPDVGEKIVLQINWDRRYRLMRMHSCMHMLCAAVPAPVTGGSIRDGSARLDFDLPNPPERAELEGRLNEIISENHIMSYSWISDEEMARQPDLVRTMSVKPPSGSGRVRLVRFGSADLQACGGTHVANSIEIGRVRVESIKNKGKQNRRITVGFG